MGVNNNIQHLSQGKILIIDNQQEVLEQVSEALLKSNFQVVVATDGENGFEKFKQEQPDLIILEVNLPRMDGFEVCSKVKEISSVPIIILSSKNGELDRLMGFRMGGDDYVTKPCSSRELVLRVQAIINRIKTPVVGTYLLVGDIKINHSTHELLMNNKKLVLTPREFQLFKILASNPNFVFSKAKLAEEIWNNVDNSEQFNISVLIKRIREKIEIDPSNPKYIKTVRGRGYRLVINSDE